MKYKVLITLSVLILLIFCSGITYSFFHSNATLVSNDQDIAKFVFNAENLNQLELPLTDLNPGDTNEYTFSVSNNYSGVTSDVSLEYQMTIKTYHLAPLIIELYKLVDTSEVLVLTCDETFTRNDQNELICNTAIEQMVYSSLKLDNYKLKVKFSSEYDEETYSDLVDYINIEIKSWQKTGD
jgi:hypothetical protein